MSTQTKDLAEMFLRVYSAQSADELRGAYNDWAVEYEEDLQSLGWTAPEETVAALASFLPRTDVPILDIGAGTGLVGEALADRGYTTVDALDLSEEMLRVCEGKGVYRALLRGELGKPLPIPSSSYDAVIAVGVLTQGHAGPECFNEITRILKPGGYFAFAITTDVREHLGFCEAEARYVREGQWRLVKCGHAITGFRDLAYAPYEVWIYEKRA